MTEMCSYAYTQMEIDFAVFAERTFLCDTYKTVPYCEWQRASIMPEFALAFMRLNVSVIIMSYSYIRSLVRDVFLTSKIAVYNVKSKVNAVILTSSRV